jgi:uncharacterized OB-fold protein
MRDRKELLASRCPKCGELRMPARSFCPQCFEATPELVSLRRSGYVKTFTVLHLSLEEQPLAPPALAALIGWEGVQGGLVHRLGECEPGSVKRGMWVEPVWAEERTGSMQDIRYFRPAP